MDIVDEVMEMKKPLGMKDDERGVPDATVCNLFMWTVKEEEA